MSEQQHLFPFSAIVGQEDLKTALLLNAVSPRVGGVLIQGDKGNGKSTAVRALSELLPPVSAVPDCPHRCDPEQPFSFCPHCQGTPQGGKAERVPPRVVELPLGAMEDRLLGHPDLEAAMTRGERRFEPGLLARAHRGVLYVDEVNLLEDHLVDNLLDAAASGWNRVEREGFSVSHPSRFLLVGTMNPEEGELRPQLLDRFGLAVEVKTPDTPEERLAVMERRMAFDGDPEGFRRRWEGEQTRVAQRLIEARDRLPRVVLSKEQLKQVARITLEADAEGVRADLVICEAAKALAAYEGREEATAEDVRRAAHLALMHRARQPWQPDPDPSGGGSGGEESSPDSGENADGPTEEEESTASSSPSFSHSGEEKKSDESMDQQETEGSKDLSPRSFSDDSGKEREPVTAAGPENQEAREQGKAQTPDALSSPFESPLREELFPVDSWFRVDADSRLKKGTDRREKPGKVSKGSVSPGKGRAALDEDPRQGRWVRSRTLTDPAEVRSFRIDWNGSLWAAAVRAGVSSAGGSLLQPEDLRRKVMVRPPREGVLFLIDTSGSMAGFRRMEQVKGAVQSMVEGCYRRRERFALLSFRNGRTETVLPPSRSVQAATQALKRLPSGGNTPLALALDRSREWLARWQARQPDWRLRFVLFTDGRVNLRRSGSMGKESSSTEEVLQAARRLAEGNIRAEVVDTETGPIRLGWARAIARALEAPVVPMDQLRRVDGSVG
ncbi:VWA domain-containing protein [Paludifilum halophilum]|uniref:Mg-protoporphyrin IX chelatase n=1 Tax=Paludifilum halophilum TaxID=1642702 RepID=A0A235B966_9BACL|nr:VWA domain-containing protein [Paludifilum halophilum]OYD08801.1 hypothetical protein CHM34_03115 [Paludifilum halophilum]